MDDGESGDVAKSWQVQRYSRREGSSWVGVNDGSGPYVLHAKAGQLLLTQSGTVLESLPLFNHSQTHAVVKGDTILVAARHQNTSRKFKVRFSSVFATQDCVKLLQIYFPVKDITKPQETMPVPLGQMLQQLMQTSPAEGLPNPDPIPSLFPLEETLQICILDPSFPSLVARVAETLEKFGVLSDTN